MVGNIKDYTPNFLFNIPDFNVATWHDYIEENFRNIDALLHNLFGIQNYKGVWKTNTIYNAGDILFIGKDPDPYFAGRLVIVLKDNTSTAGFEYASEAIRAMPDHYELFADASTAQIYARLARDWACKTDGTVINAENIDTGEYSAKQNAIFAQTWADGDSVDVAELGGTHSSMGAAGLSFGYAVAPEDVTVESFVNNHKIVVTGQDCTINGSNVVRIVGGDNIKVETSGETITISTTGTFGDYATKDWVHELVDDTLAGISQAVDSINGEIV